jgi:hypothetical protein
MATAAEPAMPGRRSGRKGHAILRVGAPVDAATGVAHVEITSRSWTKAHPWPLLTVGPPH